VLRDAAIEFAGNVINECFQYDTNYKLLDAIIEGLDFQHASTRCVCADLLAFVMEHTSNLEKEDATEDEKSLLEKLDNAVKKNHQ